MASTKLSTFILPDLVEIQRASFCWFLEEGLAEEIKSFSPITDYTGNLELHFFGDQYKLKCPKYPRMAIFMFGTEAIGTTWVILLDHKVYRASKAYKAMLDPLGHKAYKAM
jgi:DNA-directed RNA polymerase beta subunit